MQHHHEQSGNFKTIYSNVTPCGFEDIEVLFGLKVRVKKGRISDNEKQMLQSLNDRLSEIGFIKVLSVPSNFEILTKLRNSQEHLYEAHQKQKDQSVYLKEQEEKKGNQFQETVNYEKKSQQNSKHYQENSNNQKQESNTFQNVSSLRQQIQFPVHQQQPLYTPQQGQEEKLKYDFFTSSSSSSSKPQQNFEKFSKLKGWFFVDLSEEISSAHSLQNNVSENKYQNILSSIWDQLSVIKNKELCQLYNITESGRNQEQSTLKSTQAYLNKCNFWMSEKPYFLSTTLSETIDPSTVKSQESIYQPFDLRVIFTEDDNTNCFRSLIFGLLFYSLAFQTSNEIITELVSSDVSISIKLVLFHIIEMCYQKKLTQKELAVNLSLLFRFNRFSNDLLSFFSKQLPRGCEFWNSERFIHDFATKFNCLVVFQNLSPFGSTAKIANPGQKRDNFIFIDITQKGCALNLYYQEDNLNSCINTYQEKLGQYFILPSI